MQIHLTADAKKKAKEKTREEKHFIAYYFSILKVSKYKIFNKDLHFLFRILFILSTKTIIE